MVNIKFLIGDATTLATTDQLRDMKRKTLPAGRWAVYQNHDMGHPMLGHTVFVQCGPNCTWKEASPRLHDGSWGLGWRYLHVGYIDPETGNFSAE